MDGIFTQVVKWLETLAKSGSSQSTGLVPSIKIPMASAVALIALGVPALKTGMEGHPRRVGEQPPTGIFQAPSVSVVELEQLHQTPGSPVALASESQFTRVPPRSAGFRD